MTEAAPPAALLPFALARVDDRLLHGQVLLNWVRALRPRRLSVVDDALAADPLARSLLLSVAPPHLEAWLGSISEAVAVLAPAPVALTRATFLLLRSPEAAWATFRAGVRFAALEVGCLGHSAGRVRVAAQVYLSPAEMEALWNLAACGVTVMARALPTDVPLSLEEIAQRVARGGELPRSS